MQAEDRKENETNSLEGWIKSSWSNLSKKSFYPYFVGGLIFVLAVVAWNWYSGNEAGKAATAWVEFDRIETREDLKKFIEAKRGELVGDLAVIRLARIDLGPDGIAQMGTRDPQQRKQSLTNIVEGRDLLLELVNRLKDNPVFAVEAWLGLARSEEILVGATLPEKSESSLGDLDKSISYYEKALALMQPESTEGKKLKEYLTNLKDNKAKISQYYREFHQSVKPVEPIKKEEPKKEETKKEESKTESPKKEDLKIDLKPSEPKKDDSKTDLKKIEPIESKTPEKK